MNKSLLRSGSFFVIANIGAGLLHYLFQVFASQQLSAAEFSSLNGWFANLALFFMLGGILQYAANFFPFSQTQMRAALVAINILSIGLLVAWFVFPQGQTLTKAILVLVGSSLFGWLMGQVQARMLFFVMSVANLVIAATKLALPFFTGIGTPLERYAFALFACYLPALWIISLQTWNCAAPKIEANRAHPWRLWIAPIVLSVATAVIPQMDLVLMGRVQSADDFAIFVRASLFYKAIYFLMYIVAQWFLPRQIRGEIKRAGKTWVLALAAVLSSTAMALVSPAVVHWVLRWAEAPPKDLIFLSCLNMSLLTWLFLLIQEACARHKTGAAALTLLGLGAEALLQLALAPNLEGYFITALIGQGLLVTYLLNSARKNESPSLAS